MALQYVVLTMVDRDDLPDGGAAHVARTVRRLQGAALRSARSRRWSAISRASTDPVDIVVDAAPRRLRPQHRGGAARHRAACATSAAATIGRSSVLRRAKERAPDAASPSRRSWSASARPTKRSSRRCRSARRPASTSSPSASTCARRPSTTRSIRFVHPRDVRRVRARRALDGLSLRRLGPARPLELQGGRGVRSVVPPAPARPDEGDHPLDALERRAGVEAALEIDFKRRVPPPRGCPNR